MRSYNCGRIVTKNTYEQHPFQIISGTIYMLLHWLILEEINIMKGYENMN